jgi:hypothetical protein
VIAEFAEFAGPAVTVASIVALGVWGDRRLARAFAGVASASAAIIKRLDVIEARLSALEIEAKNGGGAYSVTPPRGFEAKRN